MLYAILILAILFLFAMWRLECGNCVEIQGAAKRFLSKKNEETRLRCKAENAVEELRQENGKLERRNECLQDTCDALSAENAQIYSEREKLRTCTVEFAFSEWERKCCADVPGRVLFERDGVVLIYEGGKVVGWYLASTVQTVLRTTGLESEYEAPVAEVVE